MSAAPFAQAACNGVQESSSCWFISDPCPIKILTTVKLLSNTAWCKAVMPVKMHSCKQTADFSALIIEHTQQTKKKERAVIGT